VTGDFRFRSPAELSPKSSQLKTDGRSGTRIRGVLRDSQAPAVCLDEFPYKSELLQGTGNLFKKKERLIADACDHPNLLVLSFTLELIRLAA